MRRSFRIRVACERLRARRNPGTAIAASSAMIATTIMISTRVKPPRRLLMAFNILLLSLYFVCLTALRDTIVEVPLWSSVDANVSAFSYFFGSMHFTANLLRRAHASCLNSGVRFLKSAFRHSVGASHYIFVAVFLLRIVVLRRLTGSPFLLPMRGDMHFYDDWAQRILHGQLTDHLAFYGLPLYAYLLALIYKLAGYGPFVPGLLQACLDAGTAGVIYKLGLRVFSPASWAHPA